jgi:hypothetical protein
VQDSHAPCIQSDSDSCQKIFFLQNKTISMHSFIDVSMLHSQQQLTQKHVPLTDGCVASLHQPHLKLHIPAKHHVCLYTTTCLQVHSLPLNSYSSTCLVMCRASAGSGLQILKPDPEPTVRPGLGLVGLEPGLESLNGNMEMAHKINCFSNFLV